MVDMITESDLKRLYGEKETQERLINNAAETCKNSTSDWAKDYWFGVFKTLCEKFKRSDLYNKHLH
jgi:hypothetical protein